VGSPPPESFPSPSPTAGTKFGTPAETLALPCGITLAIPPFVLGVSLTLPFQFPPALPTLNLHFKLSCDPTNPLDVTGGLAWGAGRTSNAPPDPDDTEDSPTY
jgi:hypothetical protein